MNNFRMIRNSVLNFTEITKTAKCKQFLFFPNFCKPSSFYNSTFQAQSAPTEETSQPIKKYRKPVDWLPFQWHRRPRFNIFEQGGDKIRTNTTDLSLPKPDFEFSDELKTADEQVKYIFSLHTASTKEIKEVCRRHILKRVQRHPVDFDSLEVKITLMTINIRGLYEHLAQCRKRQKRMPRIILPILIQKRNKLLKQLREIDNDRFCWLLEELQLDYTSKPLAVRLEKYCKKWDLRRLTKEYCNKMVTDKKASYHEALKKEQIEFEEEKKNILAWIEEEEKAIKALNV